MSYLHKDNGFVFRSYFEKISHVFFYIVFFNFLAIKTEIMFSLKNILKKNCEIEINFHMKLSFVQLYLSW